MEFDKSKVYTALNADELKVGSKCIFADTVQDLRQGVQSENMNCVVLELTEIRGDGDPERFTVGDTNYLLAYLIEPPKEPQYKPFSSVEKAKEIIDKHGGWIKGEYQIRQVTGFNSEMKSVFLCNVWVSFRDLCILFTFADDGSPCGELVEE